MKTAITCLFICVQGLLAFAQSGPRFLFQHVTVDDGLSQNSVVSIAQDSTGYLWFATLNGLNRYDGHTFKHYEKQFGYITREQFSKPGEVYVDRQGRLWIIAGGQLERYQTTTDDFCLMTDFRGVTKIYQARNFDLFIGTYDQGVFKIDATTGDAMQVLDTAPGKNTILEFYETGGTVWMVCNGMIYTYGLQTNRTAEIKVHGAIDRNFSALAGTADGTLWLGSYTEGLFYKSPDNDQFLAFAHPELPNNMTVSDLLVDRKGNLWISTYGEGVYVYQHHTKNVANFKQTRNHPFALQHNDIPALYQDQQDVVWVGSDGMGAYYYDPYLFKFNVLTNWRFR